MTEIIEQDVYYEEFDPETGLHLGTRSNMPPDHVIAAGEKAIRDWYYRQKVRDEIGLESGPPRYYPPGEYPERGGIRTFVGGESWNPNTAQHLERMRKRDRENTGSGRMRVAANYSIPPESRMSQAGPSRQSDIQQTQFSRDPRAAAQATRSSPLVPGRTSPMPRYYEPHGPNPGPRRPLQREVAPSMLVPDVTVPRPLPGSSFPPYTPQSQTGQYGWRKKMAEKERKHKKAIDKLTREKRKAEKELSDLLQEMDGLRRGAERPERISPSLTAQSIMGPTSPPPPPFSRLVPPSYQSPPPPPLPTNVPPRRPAQLQYQPVREGMMDTQRNRLNPWSPAGQYPFRSQYDRTTYPR